MDTPKVSVIIPVYNVEAYLPECLDSLLRQTLKNFEIICIDDGSTDNSLSILKEYQNRDERIQIIQQANSGAGIARNKGLEIARGKYLSILDADDFFDAEMLERAYKRAESTSAEIVMFRSNRYDHQKKVRYDLPHMMNKAKFPSKNIFSIWDILEMGNNYLFAIYGWTWDKMFLRSFVQENRLTFQGTRIFNDMFFTYSALSIAQRITYFEDALLCQRVNRTGAISKSVQNNWDCIFEALLALKEFLIQNSLYPQLQKIFNEYALHMIVFTYRQVDGSEKQKMRIVCRHFGLKSLGIDLLNPGNELNESEVSEAKSEFILSEDSIIFQNRENGAEREIQNLKSEIRIIHSSASYRIGRFITFIPRKIRGGIRCCQEHGLYYTLRLVKKKFKTMMGV